MRQRRPQGGRRPDRWLDRLDILVINAGVAVIGDARELDPDRIDHLIDVNIRGPYFAAVAAGRKMTDGGRIVVMGSVNGDRIPFAGGAAYAMTKSAMQGLTRGLARDFGPQGITVNNVQPGPVDTDMNPADGPLAGMMHEPMALKRHASAGRGGGDGRVSGGAGGRNSDRRAAHDRRRVWGVGVILAMGEG